MCMALDLAKCIVTRCIEDGCPISNLQLQKILYFVQKDFLKRGKIAFTDDIEAWRFGPVVPAVYYNFCGYGAMPIYMRYDDVKINVCEEDLTAIFSIVAEKRTMSPWQLVADTHKPGGAWDVTYQGGQGDRQVIKRDLIKSEG